MAKRIFQDINDLQDEMYREAEKKYNGVYIGKPLDNFYSQLHDKVDPEVYTWYLLESCCITIPVRWIVNCVKTIWKDVTTKQVVGWLIKHKKERHELQFPAEWCTGIILPD